MPAPSFNGYLNAGVTPPQANDTTTTSVQPFVPALGGSYAGPGTAGYTGGMSAPFAPLPPIGQIPQIAPLNAPKAPVVTAPTPQTFTGQAPTPISTGQFTAPDPLNFTKDPSYQFRLQQGEDALQRGAAARGTLLTGGTAKALEDYGQGAASQEYQNAYNRALGTYTTNRDTNQQNFGQGLAAFQGNLGAFDANTNAALGYGRLAASDAAQNFGLEDKSALEQQAYQQSIYDRQAAVQNAAADQGYERQTLDAAAQRASDDALRQQREQAIINQYGRRSTPQWGRLPLN